MSAILAVGMLAIPLIPLSEVGVLFKDFALRGNNISYEYAANKVLTLFFWCVLPFTFLCVAATVVPSLMMSKMMLAFEALSFNFDSLNPVNGFKKIFNLKTVKELVKSVIYLVVFSFLVFFVYEKYAHMLFSLIYLPVDSLGRVLVETVTAIVFAALLFFFFIIGMDTVVAYFLFIKDQRMDKQEVKDEYKEQEGSHEVKSRQREVREEMLSQQEQSKVDQSNFLLANPTHIAIGIYLNQKISLLPFVSVYAKGNKALAFIKYAEKTGKPVVRDIKLARALFKATKKFTYIPMEFVEPVYNIINWLLQVELAHATEIANAMQEPQSDVPQTLAAKPKAGKAEQSKPEVAKNEPDTKPAGKE